jgi:formate hydrogenlyase subunit 3/multisubunit Na+/H+ antiporter MnhD subunit
VNPLIILAVLMGTAFLMPLFEKTGKFLPRLAFLSALGVLAAGSAIGLAGLALGGPVIEAATAGFSPPMSINLRAGLPEAALWTASAFILLIGGVYLIRRERDGMYDRMLFLIVALGVSGLILTRDLFNVFGLPGNHIPWRLRPDRPGRGQLSAGRIQVHGGRGHGVHSVPHRHGVPLSSHRHAEPG